MNVRKKINKGSGPVIVDLDIPMRDSVEGALGEIEKTKGEGEHPAAKVQPVEPAEKTPPPEGSERSEDGKGYWYPAFKLKDNPFRHFETRLEEDKDVGPYIDTEMDQKVRALLKAKVSAIIRGARGCGKSCLVSFVDSKDKLIRAATPKDIANLYDLIFFGLDLATREESAKELWGENLEKLMDHKHATGTVGQESACVVCPKRCVLPAALGEKRTIVKIGYIPSPCKARAAIAQNAIEIYALGGCLLDVPDDINKRYLKDLATICDPLIREGPLIIFATRDQTRMLAESDIFSRLPIIEFERPTGEFFIKLFKGRINASRENGRPYPFEDDAIEKIASLADYNAREFIRICALVLVEMWLRGIKSPCTSAFLSELNIQPAAPNDRTTIVRILKRHEGQWAGIQELAREISGALGAPFSERKVGAMVRELGFGQFKHGAGGRMQVLISPSVLNAIK